MHPDEAAIRNLIHEWMAATAAGQTDRLVPLMDEDVVFLLPGQPPMRGRNTFIKMMQQSIGRIRIESKSDVQEIHIVGDFAYCWNYLQVKVTPAAGGEAKRRSGATLSVLRKQHDGKWVIFRDANMLAADE